MPTRKTTAKKTTTSKTKKAAPKRASSKATTKKRAAKKKAPAKRKKKSSAKSAGDAEVTIDRRRNDDTLSPEPKLERRKKVQRRRQIDPTTCERDYSDQEVEFMNALDDYKRKSGRMFPTCSEVLEVIRGLGYVQLSPAELAARTSVDEPTDELFDTTEEHEDAELEAELVG